MRLRAAALWLLPLLGGVACVPAPGTPPVAPRPDAGSTVGTRSPASAHDRIVRLHLRGLTGADYTLHVAHECGRDHHERGRTDGDHTLRLPPGPCVATLRRVREGRQERFEHAFTVTDGAEQDTTWDVAGTPGRALGR